MTDSLGLYLHIPFCKSKCSYCDFFSKTKTETDYDIFCNKMKNAIIYWGNQTNRKITTIYFGGGTPSILGSQRLCKLLHHVKENFQISDNAEITVELNPDSGKALDFPKMKNAGFNRLSIGLQSAIPNELKTLGRIHSINDARLTVQKAQAADIKNLSLDLMMGIPHQTINSLKTSIDFCVSLGIKHISAYLLKIEKGTKFYKLRNKLHIANEDEQADLYLFAVEYLETLGLKQYEISNFAIKGYESRHNSAYWQCREYIGIGPSAHSFFEGKRFYYARSYNEFAANILHKDGQGGSEEEFIMLALRLKNGLRFADYYEHFHKELSPLLLEKIQKYVKLEMMKQDHTHVCFTPKGFLVSNTILGDLLYDDI